MALIIIGGLGFIVWQDIYEKGFKFKKYLLQTKIVLIMTIILIVGGAYYFIYLNVKIHFLPCLKKK